MVNEKVKADNQQMLEQLEELGIRACDGKIPKRRTGCIQKIS